LFGSFASQSLTKWLQFTINRKGEDGRGEPEVGAELLRAKEKEKEGGQLVCCCGHQRRMYFNLHDVLNSIQAQPKTWMHQSHAPVMWTWQK